MTGGNAPTIAILGSGEMGSAIGRCLADSGFAVTTCLAGRSRLSQERAGHAGMVDTGSLDALLSGADMLLSIIPPAAALEFAEQVCPLLGASSKRPLFVDCNAVSPATIESVASVAAAHGVRFQDAGIIGAAPGEDLVPVRLYTSGAFTQEVERLAMQHIAVKPLGDIPGRASAMKMIYASLTKGTHALRAAAITASVAAGVDREIYEEWGYSLPDALRSMQKRMPRLPMVAERWAGEMREIAETYRSLGMTPSFHEGAEWVYDLIAGLDDSTAGEAPDMDVEELAVAFAGLLERDGSAT
jgi:3-hydroxyisobutyrate dehydrogenase-like beta-hydroxyacid dehydrogenase